MEFIDLRNGLTLSDLLSLAGMAIVVSIVVELLKRTLDWPKEFVARFAPLAASRDVGIDLELEPAVARADRDRLAQVLSNYLSNALRHAPDGSTVTVRTAAANGRARISVTDHGQGLAADQLEVVFERFYRVDPARSRASGGSGIGLAIVRALAQAMGGRAWAESAGPGAGATFLLELPSA